MVTRRSHRGYFIGEDVAKATTSIGFILVLLFVWGAAWGSFLVRVQGHAASTARMIRPTGWANPRAIHPHLLSSEAQIRVTSPVKKEGRFDSGGGREPAKV